MIEIHHDQYQVSYDPATATVFYSGSMRLQDREYALILQMLNDAVTAGPDTVTLDVRALRFLNSSGINTLSKFVMRLRQQQSCQLVVKGNELYPWQHKSLKNLQRLFPGVQLKWE